MIDTSVDLVATFILNFFGFFGHIVHIFFFSDTGFALRTLCLHLSHAPSFAFLEIGSHFMAVLAWNTILFMLPA
jgi:hypothetical protein